MSDEQPLALRLADDLLSCVQTYPQMSEDEPGGYCTAEDQLKDDAAAELRRLHECLEQACALNTELDKRCAECEGRYLKLMDIYAEARELIARQGREVEALRVGAERIERQHAALYGDEL